MRSRRLAQLVAQSLASRTAWTWPTAAAANSAHKKRARHAHRSHGERRAIAARHANTQSEVREGPRRSWISCVIDTIPIDTFHIALQNRLSTAAAAAAVALKYASIQLNPT
uniref:Putative secreted protein n=1 Tax=Anopheles marajoara TaxID=58244 RepID=A0A2M4C8W4_9DIPT